MTEPRFTLGKRDGDLELHLKRGTAQDDKPVPDDQAALQQRIYLTQRILHFIADRTTHLEDYRHRLEQVALAGLVQPNVQVKLAGDALTQIQEEIAQREGRIIKLRYLIKLGRWAVALAAAALLLYWDHSVRAAADGAAPGWNAVRAYYLVWAGAMAGVWVSVASSRARVRFEDLPTLIDHRTEPVIRLVYTGLLACVFALFLVVKLVEVKVGALETAQLGAVPTALVVGVISGFAEKTLSLRLVRRARELVGDPAA